MWEISSREKEDYRYRRRFVQEDDEKSDDY